MLVLVGLGNPGKEYEKTRHNAGFELIDVLAKKVPALTAQKPLKKFDAELVLTPHLTTVKPLTFMNDSGVPVRQVLNYYAQFKQEPRLALEQLYVAHDDLDIQLGAFKIQFGKGPKVHNGLLSLYQHLGSDQFWHVRLGVDNRAGDRSMPGHAYVLQQFRASEHTTFMTTLQEVSHQLQQTWENNAKDQTKR
jgi:peptidyl-tRNA hydrolase, PTH1 family